uniref:Uncharacterized protein n=1 Tax=Vitis vinifera TaxID=29760 RepID=F6HAI5_VITVI
MRFLDFFFPSKMRTWLGLKEGIDLMDLGLREMGSFNDWRWV